MKTHTFKTASFWINNCSVPQTNDMARKKTKFCLSWPNKTLEISGRLRNIAVLLTGRTIMSPSNFILSLSPLVYRMWCHFLLADPNTKKVPGVAECSPPPLINTHWFPLVRAIGLQPAVQPDVSAQNPRYSPQRQWRPSVTTVIVGLI